MVQIPACRHSLLAESCAHVHHLVHSKFCESVKFFQLGLRRLLGLRIVNKRVQQFSSVFEAVEGSSSSVPDIVTPAIADRSEGFPSVFSVFFSFFPFFIFSSFYEKKLFLNFFFFFSVCPFFSYFHFFHFFMFFVFFVVFRFLSFFVLFFFASFLFSLLFFFSFSPPLPGATPEASSGTSLKPYVLILRHDSG